MFLDPNFEPCHEAPGDSEEDEGEDEDEDDSDDALHCGWERGYIIVTTVLEDDAELRAQRGLGVTASERYFDDNRMSTLNGIPLSDSPEGPTRFYSPQVIAFQGCSSIVNLINPTKDWLNVTLYLKDDQGEDLAGPANLTLRAGHLKRADITNLFGLNDTGVMVTGWLQIDVDQTGLVGDVELQLFDGRAMTTVPLTGEPSRDMTFPYVPGGTNYFTGLALLNTSDGSANIEIEAFRPDGVSIHKSTLTLAPQARISQMLSEYANEFDTRAGAYLKISSDQDLVGLELFLSGDYEVVASVDPQ
jgi:hypothetical protein